MRVELCESAFSTQLPSAVQKLTLKLLGTPQISLDGQPLTQFVSRKAQALLIYIAVTRKPYAREVLANLFWWNLSSPQALKNLRTILPNLRQLVGSHLIITRQTIEFNRDCAYCLDVEAIQALQNHKTDNIQFLCEAVSQYAGDFLEGFYVPDAPDFENWALMERERFRELAIEGLHTLAEQYRVQQNYAAGLTVTRKLLQLDPWRETAHQQQMICLACTRQRRAALAQYETCRRMLADEFNAEPMTVTKMLYERIRSGEIGDSEESMRDILKISAQKSSPIVLLPVSDRVSADEEIAAAPACCDWGEAVDVSIFYGREIELLTLQQHIVQDHCRLILMLGMGGIGKTTLVTKLAQMVEPHFDYVIWRSLRNAPPLESLLADLVPFLSDRQDSQMTVERLLHWLRSHRCLVILDNIESVLQEGNRIGQYRAGYEHYSQLFKAVAEGPHQSCILLTSREQLAEITVLDGDPLVQVFPLVGSPTTAQLLLTSRKLLGSVAQKQQLAAQYSCNPLALKIVAGLIHDLFEGKIEEFLKQGVVLFNGIRRLLEQQFERLSPLERSIMYWLAINREWTSVDELAADLTPAVAPSRLLEVLESLSWRNLIERQQDCYTQQPMMMEYVTNALIEKIVNELISNKIYLFNKYALLKTNAKKYVRRTQRRLILVEVATQLQDRLETSEGMEAQLQDILASLHHSSDSLVYAAGNLINLCGYLQLDLTNYDFSHLPIRQADLQKISLQSVNFQNSRFEYTLFTQVSKFPFSLAFNPEGTMLVHGDGGGHLAVRRVSDDQLLWSCQGHSITIWTIAWSSDDCIFATGSNDGSIRLWDPLTGECLQTIQATSVVWMVTWSPDNRTLASAGSEEAVRLWDMQTGRCLDMLETQQQGNKAVVWSPDDDWIASGGNDGTIKFWHPATGELLRTLVGHSQEIWHLALSTGDRPLLASSSADHTIRIWEPQTGQCLHVLQGHCNTVLRVVWSPDGRTLASSSDDATIRLWDAQTGQCLRILQGHQSSVWSLVWSPIAPLLASGSADHTTRFWDAQTGDCLKILQGYSACMRALAWHADSQTLAAGSDDHMIRLWDTTTGTCLKKLRGQTNSIWSIAWSPDYEMIASASDNRIIELWNPQTGKCLKTLNDHTNWIWSVTWSPDSQRLYSGSNDQSIRVWDSKTGRCLQQFEHSGWVTAIDPSPDGKTLASGGIDCLIWLLDLETGDRSRKLQGHTGWIWSVACSPDGKMLVSGSEDGTVRLWDMQIDQCLQVFQASSERIFSVVWSPDGERVACGGSDAIVRIWHVKTGQCIQRLEGHGGSLWSVAWQPAGQLLASSAADDTVRIWQVDTGECLRVLRADRPYENMNIVGATGLTEADKVALKELGACE